MKLENKLFDKNRKIKQTKVFKKNIENCYTVFLCFKNAEKTVIENVIK